MLDFFPGPGLYIQAAAIRELEEEAGSNLKFANVSFLGVYNFTEMEPKHYVDVSFSAEYVSGKPENSAPNETTDWQWFDLDNLPEPLFPPVAVHLRALKSGEKFFDSHVKVYKPRVTP